MVLFDRLQEADWYALFINPDTFPRVDAYWNRLRERPSFAAGVDAFRHPLVTQGKRDIQRSRKDNPAFDARFSLGCPAAGRAGPGAREPGLA